MNLAVASPRCHEGACERPVQRVENRWHLDEDGVWRLVATMVCVGGHRVIVEPIA